MLKGLVNGNYRVEICIHLLDLTRNSFENATVTNTRFLAGIEPAIPIQRSNQLSYRVQLSSSNHKFMYIYICILGYLGYCHVRLLGKYQDFIGISLD